MSTRSQARQPGPAIRRRFDKHAALRYIGAGAQARDETRTLVLSRIPAVTRAGPRTSTADTRRTAALCLVLALVPLALFWQVLGHDFVSYDDPQYITENSDVQQGVTPKSIAWAFTTVHGSNWHPMTWISHMLDFRAFGLNPRGYHLVNVLFHVANALLVFLVLKRMTGSTWRTFLVAALFAVHPLHVESVAWVSERKDVLSAFFMLLTIAAFLRFVRGPSVPCYLVVLFFFALGLLSKPTIVTLPAVLLLLDYWPLGRFPSHAPAGGRPLRPWSSLGPLLREKAPLFLLAAVASALTIYAPWLRGALAAPEIRPFAVRLANAVVSPVAYVGKTIFPRDLSFLYLFPERVPPWHWAGAGLLIAAATCLAARFGRRRPHCLVGWLWFTGTLLPMIGLVQVGVQSMADRYTYVPHIGLFLLASWGLTEGAPARRSWKAALALCAVAVLALFSAVAWRQARHWKDSTSLYGHALEVAEGNYVAHFGLGVEWVNQGRHEQALSHFLRAVQLHPGYFQARQELVREYNILGVALAESGDLEAAVERFAAALQIDPRSEESLSNLGTALSKMDRAQEAVGQYRRFLEANPTSRMAHLRLSALLSAQGATEEAGRHLMLAMGIDPDAADAGERLERAVSEGDPTGRGHAP